MIASDIQTAFSMLHRSELQTAWNLLQKHYSSILNLRLPVEVPTSYYYLLGMLLERKKRFYEAIIAYRIALLILGFLTFFVP